MASSPEKSASYYGALFPLLGFVPLERYHWRSPHGFRVPAPKDVAAVKAGMAEQGSDVAEIQNLGSVTALFLKDPDGIRFEISYFPPEIDANA